MRCVTLLLALLPSAAWASDFHSPRTAALGGAGHAGPMLNDSIYLNPSYSSFLPTYSFSTNWLWFRGNTQDFGQGPTDYYGYGLNASIQDGRSDLFQAGVGYTRRENNQNLIHIGASKAFVQRIGVGIGGKIFFKSNEEGGAKLKTDTTVSVTGVALDWVQLSLLADNLIQTDEGKEFGLYREYTLGTKVNIKGIAMLYFDPHYAPDAPGGMYGYEAGAELSIVSDFFLRGGFFRASNIPFENVRGHGWGLGVGWIAPRISFDYAYQRAVDPVFASSHNIGVTVFF